MNAGSQHDFDMGQKSESSATEIQRLKDCIGDLLSVSAYWQLHAAASLGTFCTLLEVLLVPCARIRVGVEFKLTGMQVLQASRASRNCLTG